MDKTDKKPKSFCDSSLLFLSLRLLTNEKIEQSYEETEKLIQDAINRLAVGRTTFAIAHRLSTLRNADKILVLDHGNLVEFGTHKELLDKRGYYFKLVMAQKKAAEDGVELDE